MGSQAGKPSHKKSKQLACKRCRHRKQKCTDIRPCENCTQSGSECIPSEPAAAKAQLETDYVQQLEERVAQLESLIPQERLDHIDDMQQSAYAETIPAVQLSNREHSVSEFSSPRDTRQPNGTYMNIRPRILNDTLTTGELVLFDNMTGIFKPWNSRKSDEDIVDVPDLGMELEHFLIRNYFDMAHSQYPVLLKPEFMLWCRQWREADGNPPESTKWMGFFIYMVFAISFLMTKSRINGPARSHTVYQIATTNYLRYAMASRDTMIPAQAYLLLTLHALHMPSHDAIITLSSRAIRFCVSAQFHLIETEPKPTSGTEWIQVQHRRRVFWCAYAMNRVACSSFALPSCISDSHITAPMFDNIDDEQLSDVTESVSWRTQVKGSDSPTSISSALHIIVGRQIEAEIQDMMLHKDFIPDSEASFLWRSRMLEKLKQWNRDSVKCASMSRNGYVSLRWHKMIYYYGIVMLYRPTRTNARGISGDLCVRASCQALLLFRRFQLAKEIARPWLGLLTQFQIGIALLYCIFCSHPSQWPPSYKSTDVSDAIRACSSILAVLAERWSEVECIRDTFEVLATEIPLGETWERPERISSTGRAIIEENWSGVSNIVIHRPTLRMIREMAADKFVDASEQEEDATSLRATTAILDGVDLQWTNQLDFPTLGMESSMYLGSEFESFFT